MYDMHSLETCQFLLENLRFAHFFTCEMWVLTPPLHLIAHPETAAKYVTLKRELFEKFEFDRDGYMVAKGCSSVHKSFLRPEASHRPDVA